MPVQNGATTTSDAGNARFNPESGILSFTQPGFDPTKQTICAWGTGAISNAAAGKTLLLAPSGIAGAAQPIGAVDAYGNSTARTDQMKAELAQLQANGGQSEGPRVSMLQSLPAEQADRDRLRSSSGKRMLTGWPMIWQPAAAMRAATPGGSRR